MKKEIKKDSYGLNSNQLTSIIEGLPYARKWFMEWNFKMERLSLQLAVQLNSLQDWVREVDDGKTNQEGTVKPLQLN